MKNISRLFVGFLLILPILFSAFTGSPVQASAAPSPSDPMIRVGLYYGSNGLPSANLANQIGSGYYFGFFDSSRAFIQTGYTAEEKITVLKDNTVYIKGGTYYDSLPPEGSVTIGSFHIDAGSQYSSFDEAAAAATKLSSSTGLPAFPAYISGDYRVRIGTYTTIDSANSAAASLGLQGASGTGGSATCYTVVVTSTGQILFELDCGSSATLAINPTGADDTETWFKGYKYAGAFEYRRNSGSDLTVINVLPLSAYTKGVLPYEMNPKWNAEALKAQALCVASYAYSSLNKHGSLGFDVCNTTDCQVYRGRNTATTNSDDAAEAVKGLALYCDNKIINAVYHSSNGGYTESAKNVWGTDWPYLQAVPDHFEDLSAANNGIWSFEYSGADITWILQNKGYSIGPVVDANVDQYTPAGNVYRVTFTDSSGKTLSFEKESARNILNSSTLKKYTYSPRFTISGGIRFHVNDASTTVSAADGYAIGVGGSVTRLSSRSDLYLLSSGGKSALKSNTDSFIVSGKGWGHNVGMSQYGAKGMAEQGYTYDQIVKYYYTGITIQPIN